MNAKVSADESVCNVVIGEPPVHRKKVRKLRVIKYTIGVYSLYKNQNKTYKPRQVVDMPPVDKEGICWIRKGRY